MHTLDIFIGLAEIWMLRLFRKLYALRTVSPRGSADVKATGIQRQQRMVLTQVSVLRCMKNPHCLKWWALISSIRYYDLGAGQTVITAVLVIGHCASAQMHDSVISSPCKDIVGRQMWLFFHRDAITFIVDNDGKTALLKHHRG